MLLYVHAFERAVYPNKYVLGCRAESLLIDYYSSLMLIRRLFTLLDFMDWYSPLKTFNICQFEPLSNIPFCTISFIAFDFTKFISCGKVQREKSDM
jgi:hypothetical protein